MSKHRFRKRALGSAHKKPNHTCTNVTRAMFVAKWYAAAGAQEAAARGSAKDSAAEGVLAAALLWCARDSGAEEAAALGLRETQRPVATVVD